MAPPAGDVDGVASNPYPFNKVELHCHLDGCYRAETIAELGRERGINLPSYDPEKLKDYITATTPCSSLPDYIGKLNIASRAFGGNADAITRIAREAVEDKARAGLKYIEFRYSPQLLANCDVKPLFYESGRLRPKDVVDVVNAALTAAAHDYGVMVRTILCDITLYTWSQEVVGLCEEYRDKGVVGFDISGPEDLHSFPARVEKAYQRCEASGIHRTAHAGEVGPAIKVKEAIESLHVERIGHGYHVVDDSNVYDLARRTKTHFEVCPLSSHLTTAVTVPWSEHPAKRLLADGVNFSLSTDDPGIHGCGIARDYDIATNDMDFTIADLLRLNLNAAKSCFLDGSEKQQLIHDLEKEYGPFTTPSHQ